MKAVRQQAVARRGSRDESGSVLILTAVMMTMLLGVAALALDGSHVYEERARLSAAADAAAIAAARHLRIATTATAESIALAEAARMQLTPGNGTTITVNNPPLSGPYSGNAAYVEVIMSRVTGTFFAGMLGFGSLTPAARAVAGTQLSLDCVVALDTSGQAINLQTNASLVLGNCIAHSNANAGVSTTASISASRLFLTGTCSGRGCPGTGVTTGAPVKIDPLRLLPGPSVASPCSSTVVPKNSTTTLDPGCYVNLTISTGATVTLRPGVYNVTNSFSAQSNASITGSGVILHMSGTSSSVDLSPTSVLTLSGPTTGNLKGGTAGVSLRGQDTLRRLAEESGGRIYFPAREAELEAAAESIATDTHSRYLITYTPKNQVKDGKWRAVNVRVPESMRSRTRAGYFAPDPPPIRPTFEFTIQDSARNYMDVTAADLDVFEDGVAQKIDTFQEAVDPVSMVLTLDSSGSMRRAAETVKATATEFVLAVRPEDNLALITFADAPKFEHVLSTNRNWSIDAIRKYTALGGTALYDALYNSLQHLKDVKGRRAVVLLSDGRDEDNPGKGPGSKHVLSDVLALQQKVGATVYAIGLGTNLDYETLEKLADQSGGQTYYAEDASALSDQFRKIVEDLRRRYVLSYSSTNRTADGNWRAVEIRPHASGLVVSGPTGYFPPNK